MSNSPGAGASAVGLMRGSCDDNGYMVTTLRNGKANLSELVDRASRGEDILISVRGKVKARLTRVRTPQAGLGAAWAGDSRLIVQRQNLPAVIRRPMPDCETFAPGSDCGSCRRNSQTRSGLGPGVEYWNGQILAAGSHLSRGSGRIRTAANSESARHQVGR